MSEQSPDPRPVRYVWDEKHQRHAEWRHNPNNLWDFIEWKPLSWQPPAHARNDSGYEAPSSYAPSTHAGGPQYHTQYTQSNPSQAATSSGVGRLPKGEGARLLGQYNAALGATANNLHYETLDHSYFVRDRKFFQEGKVFAVILSETAGATATSYNTSISEVRFPGHYVHTQNRRFVVVRQRREFCYACPIFTYSLQGTKKKGVRPEEHGIAYSSGQKPTLLAGEIGIKKPSIAIDMAPNVPNLHSASRIYYGIHHPVQYNVKVKDIGQVPEGYLPALIGNWTAEDNSDTKQAPDVTAGAEDDELPDISEEEHDGMSKKKRGKMPKVSRERSSSPDASRDPHLYHPTNNTYGYNKNIYPHMFHPKHNPFGYHPTHNTSGYHPSSNPWCYHPEHNAIGYHPSENPFSYHPKYNPHGYHPQRTPFCWHPRFSPYGYHSLKNASGFHPHVTPDNFHPEANPLGYHPSHDTHEYDSRHNKYAYHKKYNPSGYHPKVNDLAYHPTLNKHARHTKHNPYGYHPTHCPTAYHPKYNPHGPLYDDNGQIIQDDDDADGGANDDDDDDEDDSQDLYAIA